MVLLQKRNGLIQLQNNRFFYNWRKMHADEPYPRYGSVVKKFKANLELFQRFLEEEKLGPFSPTECELTYINHILKGEGGSRYQIFLMYFRTSAGVPKNRDS